MPVYCVRFDPEEIWKGNTEKNATIYADIFEAYLDKLELMRQLAPEAGRRGPTRLPNERIRP